jgi:hypothetical protein
MKKRQRTFYLLSLFVILTASAYPIYMGIVTLVSYKQHGFIHAANYPKYIIPYTPLSIALIMVVALMPWCYRVFKTRSLLILSLMGATVFISCEWYLEGVKVLVSQDVKPFTISQKEEVGSVDFHEAVPTPAPKGKPTATANDGSPSIVIQQADTTPAASGIKIQLVPLESWQLSLCSSPRQPTIVMTPTAPSTKDPAATIPAASISVPVNTPVYATNNLVFKVHFYLIALVILLVVTHTVYGFTRMFMEEEYEKKKPLVAQLVAVSSFIGLCVFACFTAFYRTGALLVSPISAVLMSVFFIVFGVTAGTYFGCLFYNRSKWLSVAVPVVVALFTTIAMYVGELMLTGGVLYKFGTGWLFEPAAGTPYSIVDVLVIMLSGIVTYALMRKLAPHTPER